jgi:hypothetical protein
MESEFLVHRRSWFLLLLAACLSGCGGESDSLQNDNVGAGWIRISSAQSDSQNAYLSGTAFISPGWFVCCTGSASDTGVDVSWSNSTTGASGSATQKLSYGCFLSTCWPDSHTWSANIPLATGTNLIFVVASDPAGNIGRRSFNISPGESYPNVDSVIPMDFSTNVLIDSTIAATFSDDMDAASISSNIFRLTTNNSFPVDVTISVVGSQAVLIPTAPLAPNSRYYVDISTGVKNIKGNPMLEQYHWTFTTGTN